MLNPLVSITVVCLSFVHFSQMVYNKKWSTELTIQMQAQETIEKITSP